MIMMLTLNSLVKR